MPAAIVLLLACEVELTVISAAIGWRFANSYIVMITGACSALCASAAFGLWLMWFVVPACIVNSDCAMPSSAWIYLAGGAALQWAWMLAIALSARFAKTRNLAHVLG
jgi:hypothetical protein